MDGFQPPSNWALSVLMIYFIQGEITKRIKIGFTSRFIEKRIQNLQTGSPDKLNFIGGIPGNVEIEESLHQKFKNCRLHGEWFEPTIELLDFIASNTFRTTDSVYDATSLERDGIISVEEALKMSAEELSKMYNFHTAKSLDK